jgi:mannose-6-phosphate isomerase-like protein (cupin superfamily)
VLRLNDVARRRAQSGRLYLEFLRVPAMSMGLYVLGAGAADPQKPHREDEAYYVVSGRGRIRIGSEDSPVAAGTVVFVKAGVEHRFHDITEELTILVFFAPAESTG